jgi:hypothetical protein
MPPPFTPTEAGLAESWDSVEAELGIHLPEDYKDYIAVYGAGTIDDRFRVASVFGGELGEMIREYDGSATLQSAPFPSAGLWVPFGYNFERGTAYWEAHVSDPDMWSIATEFDGHVQRFQDNLVTFLVKSILGGHFSTVLYNEATPFQIPVPFYPSFDPAILKAAFSKSDLSKDEQAELVLHMFGDAVAIGRLVDFDTFLELQARVPRVGSSIYYRTFFLDGPEGATHEIRIAVPKEQRGKAELRLIELAQRLRVDIVGDIREG